MFKPTVRIAAGVLHNQHGQYLLSSRPTGKSKAGYWEFAGGKMEVGETLFSTLQREFDEELGIQIHHARPWLTRRHFYPEKNIELNLFYIPHDGWSGQLQSREQQQWIWQNPHEPTHVRVLPSNRPILHALRIPRQLTGNPEHGFVGDNGFRVYPQQAAQAQHPVILPYKYHLDKMQDIELKWILVKNRQQYRNSTSADAWLWQVDDAQSATQLQQTLRAGTPQPIIVYASVQTIAQYGDTWHKLGAHAIVPQAT